MEINKLANIYPIKNQKWYGLEHYVMILAHLAKKGLYDGKYFNEESYIIMDNGAFEKEEIDNLEELIDLSKKLCEQRIFVDEIVIPDDVNDNDKSFNMFMNNLGIIKNHKEFNFMVVLHANDVNELNKRSKVINKICDHYGIDNITIGLSKLDCYDRIDNDLRNFIAFCPFEVHLLGIKKDYMELLYMYREIRSCDSSHLVHNIKNGRPSFFYTREVDDINIDLENDYIDDNLIANSLSNDIERKEKLFK